jgi:hypothetical protein
MLEMCKLIPMIIRDFTFSLDESLISNEWRTQAYWFFKPVNFKIKVASRKTRL